MRVLIAVHHYPPRRLGGAELMAQRQARWLAQHGVETRVVCVENVSSGASQVTWQDEVLDGIPVRRLDLQYPDNTAALRGAFENDFLTGQFRELISEWHPDLVHLISGYLLGTAPLSAAEACGIPTVVTLTDFWFLCPTIQLLKGDGTLCTGPQPLECARCLFDSRRIMHAIDQRAPQLMQAFWRNAKQYRRLGESFGLPTLLDALETRQMQLPRALEEADAVLPVTHFLANMYRENGLTGHNFFVKPNGLDMETFLATVARVHNGEIVFGYMGQLAPIKGIDILLHAFRLVQARNPTKMMRLIVYGKWNAERSYIEKIEAMARGNAAITIAGAYEHAHALQLLGEMDALVVPSLWYENAPIVIQEAFAAGTPVIGSDVGGIAELVKHEENGLLFPRGDANALSNRMQRFLDEPELGKMFASHFSPTRTYQQDMQELMKVYGEVLARAKQVTP